MTDKEEEKEGGWSEEYVTCDHLYSLRLAFEMHPRINSENVRLLLSQREPRIDGGGKS